MKIFIITLFALLSLTFANADIIRDSASAFGRVPSMTKREASAINEARAESDVKKQIEILKSASEKSWAGTAIFFNLANLEFGDGKYDAAISNYKKALEKTPSFFAAQKNLALVLASKGERDLAYAEMKRALALSGGSDADILRWIAVYQSDCGDFTSALWACSQAIVYDSSNPSLRDLQAYLLFKTEAYSECECACLSILNKNSKNKNAQILLAKSRAAKGDFLGALAPLEILDKSGNITEAELNFYADILFNMKRYADAAKLYARSKSLAGSERAVLALTESGDYQKALSLCADEVLKRKIKARQLFENGDLKGAKFEIEKYLAFKSDDIHAQYLYARLLAKLSDFEGARLRFKGLLGNSQFRALALNGVFYCSLSLKDFKEAKKYANLLDKEYPEFGAGTFLKNFKEAENAVEKSKR